MSDTKRIIRADLDEIVEVIDDLKDSIFDWDEYGVRRIDEKFLRTALERFVVEDGMPFDKALDRASLNAFDRMEFIKGANWANDFLTTPKKGGEHEA